MKKGRWNVFYAAICTLLLAAGFITVFAFACNTATGAVIACLCGLAIGFVLSPILHEGGHIGFAELANMDFVYVKFFCFRLYTKEGEKHFSFASPFAPDETRVVPRSGGNMKKRASLYTLGGLITEGGCFLLVVVAASILSVLGYNSYLLWGMAPYMGYLFLLNAAPFEYASGKTDALVYQGIRKGYDTERVMLSAMEIQGQLYEGKSFSEIDEKWYFDIPQLCEDEPLFAIMLDLCYRYYLDKNEIEKAAEQLNRLAQLQVYLSDSEVEKIAAELVYMHAIRGDFDGAEECGKLCRNYLQLQEATPKRILLAYTKAFGKEEDFELLYKQAYDCLQLENLDGVKKFEENVIDRLFEE